MKFSTSSLFIVTSLISSNCWLEGGERITFIEDSFNNTVAAYQKNLSGRIDGISSDETRMVFLFTGNFCLNINEVRQSDLEKGFSGDVVISVQGMPVVVKQWTHKDSQNWPGTEADWKGTYERLVDASEKGSIVSLAISPLKISFSGIGKLLMIEGDMIKIIDCSGQ